MQSSAKLAVLVGTHQTVNKSEEKQIDYYTRQVYKNFDLLALKELAEGDESNSLHHEKNDVEIIILRFAADLPTKYYQMFINSKLHEWKSQTDYEVLGFCIDAPV